MKQYTLLTDYSGMKKNDKILPVPGYPDSPGTYASEAELAKKPPTNFFFLSFITTHTEIFKEIDETKTPTNNAAGA
jgi:hypothetical protein